MALGIAALLAGVLTGLPTPAVQAAEGSRPAVESPGTDFTVLEPYAEYGLSPQLAAMLGRDTVDVAGLAALRTQSRTAGAPTPPVGTKLLWPAIDITNPGPAGIYLKEYELRGFGDKIEVWVASGVDATSVGTAFPPGDCRNAVPGTTDITDAQVEGLVEEFDTVIYPRETKVFSTPPDRAGTQTIPGLTAAGLNFAGAGERTVTLVDNVRDDNFYDFPTNKSFVAGFFAPIFNVLTDRNVMTIDAFDWAHRTGANPKNEPNSDLCKSRVARPHAYEGVFAHEWQHLLASYTDPNETTWLNEGLSDYAINLVGYGDTTRGVQQRRAESHIFCFQGFGTVKGPSNPNPSACGGPQNSLTLWQDEGPGSEVLADYGNVWAFVRFLADRYGEEVITTLHNDGAKQGLASVEAALAELAPKAKLADVLHDFQLTNLLDRYASKPGAEVVGIDPARITTESLDATVNLDNPAAYALPGAAPNGADYVLLRDGERALSGRQLRSFSFEGATTVPANPPQGEFLLPSTKDPNAVVDVENWHVTLVGLDTENNRVLVRSFASAFSARANAKALKAFASYPTLVAVIAHDALADVTAPVQVYAPYRLTVNGTLQRGGS
ncbi:MAG: hypothetical protein ACT4QG_08415 [Sporichthyaceae bacterium]